jgi:hypothetical protein
MDEGSGEEGKEVDELLSSRGSGAVLDGPNLSRGSSLPCKGSEEFHDVWEGNGQDRPGVRVDVDVVYYPSDLRYTSEQGNCKRRLREKEG